MQRVRDVQLIARTRHRDIQQATLFVDLCFVARCARHRKNPVCGPDDKHHVKLFSLGRVCRGENERIVVVFVAADGEILRVRRRLERERGQKCCTIRIAGRNHFQLIQIREPRWRVVVRCLENRIVQLTHQSNRFRRGVRIYASHAVEQRRKCVQPRTRARRCTHGANRHRLPSM